MITKKGRDFAKELKPWLNLSKGEMTEVEEICSLIARHAEVHHKLAEHACNRELNAIDIRQEENAEVQIKTLVERLSALSKEPMHAKFTGDPRGFTVRVVIPRAAPAYGNTWGLEGEFGV